MISCTQGSRKESNLSACLQEGADRALFDVDEVEYEFVKLSESSEDILPSKFLLKFKACMKDSLKKQPMRNHSLGIHTFRDEKESEKTITNTLCENVEWGCTPVDTDNNGCFKWEERYNFALPAEQQWIGFKRVIAHRTGTHVIPMMINPWIPGIKIVDLRPQYGKMENYLGDKPLFRLHEKLGKSHESGESEVDKCKEEGSLDQAFKNLDLDENEKKAFLWVDQVEFSPSRKVRPDNSDYKKIYNICDDSLSAEECEQNRKLDRKGGFLNLKLQIPVHIISDDESGRMDYKLVPAGAEFDVTFYLLSEIGRDSSSNGNSKKYYMLHRRVEPVTTIAGREYIHLDNALLHIPYVTIEGTSVILLKVESRGEVDMEPFYGVYEIKDKSIRDLHGTSVRLSLKSSESAPDEKVDLEKVSVSNVESQRERIEEYKKTFEQFDAENAYVLYTPELAEIDGFDHSEGLALDLSRMRFARIKASGDTCSSPVKRRVVYLGEVCLRDPRINEYLQMRPVTVTAQDMWISRNSEGRITVDPAPKNDIETIVNNRRADDRGCIQFTYELSHKLYDVQKYFMKKLTFTTNDQEESEESEYIALNPWEYGFLTYQKFTQAYENWYDAQEKYAACNKMDDSCSELMGKLKKAESDLEGPLFSENLEHPRLRLNEYRNVIIEPSYNIKPSLDIQTVKNLQVFLQPGIVRMDSPGEDRWQIPRVFPIGYYLVRFIIAKGPQETTEGKRWILDRYTKDPLDGSLNLITDMDLINHQRRFGEAFKKITAPTDTAMENLSMSALDERAEEFEQARETLKNVYQRTNYDAYGEHLKTANATEFFGDGCEEGGRTPCFTKDDYITHFDTLAYAENGVLSAFIKLGFDVEHFRHLGSKNSILIEIYPTDPEPVLGKYQYLSPETNGGNRCVLDVENTTFKPFPTCDEGNVHEGCHQLKTPSHWGLFFTTEFGMVNIMWPTERNYSEVFGLNESHPLEISGRSQYELNEEMKQLSLMENAINHVNQNHEAFGLSKVNDAYVAGFKAFVDPFTDRVKIDELKQYCENVEKQISELNSKDLLKGAESLPEKLAIGLSICSENMQDSSMPLSGTKLRNQVRKYFTYRDFADERNKGRDPLQEYRQVQSQEGSFCNERSHRATSYIDDGNDLSASALRYQDCVCNPPNEESITKKIARCFSKSQGLVFVEDNVDFLKKLGNNDENPVQVVQHNGAMKSKLDQGFLKSMCTFWFEEYYKNYLNFNHVENIYDKSISYLEFLYTNPYVEVPEEERIEGINFADFKNISTNRSGVAQWFDGAYSRDGYEPFVDYKTTSDSNHPFHVCRNDPLKFFHIERKVIVGELDTYSDRTRYNNGRVYSLTTQASRGAQIRVEQSRRQQISSSLRGEFRVETGRTTIGNSVKRIFRGVSNEIFRTTFGAGFGGEEARSGATSATEQNTMDSSKSILLAVNHVQMNLALKKHRSCFLIRPKINAFEGIRDGHWAHLRLFWSSNLPSNLSKDAVDLMKLPYTDSGILICGEESLKSLEVSENYYYIHQFFGGHAYEFMSRTIYHNRPYTEIIRGQEQMDKFIRLTQDMTYNREAGAEDPYGMRARIQHLSQDRSQLDRNLIEAFEKNALDWSGFYKGIYTYPDLINYYDSETVKSQWYDDIMDDLGNVLALPEESIY